MTRELIREKCKTVMIENDTALTEKLLDNKMLYIEGDATYDQILLRAGLKRASALITTLGNDAKNVYVALTAKRVLPSLRVIARAEGEDSMQKLEHAGADNVLTPYTLGGLRMAQLILRPTVINFLDMAIHGENLNLQMEEIRISPHSKLSGKSLIESDIRPNYNLIIIAIKKYSGDMIYNLQAHVVIEPGDTLIVVGKTSDLKSVKEIL